MNIQQIIKEKYGSDAAFARSIGWTKQKMSLILSKKRKMKLGDVILFSRTLECSVDDVVNFFAN